MSAKYKYWLIDFETVNITEYAANELIGLAVCGQLELILETNPKLRAIEAFRGPRLCSVIVSVADFDPAEERANMNKDGGT